MIDIIFEIYFLSLFIFLNFLFISALTGRAWTQERLLDASCIALVFGSIAVGILKG